MENTYKTKLWKKVVCTFLSIIIAFGTFISLTAGNFMLSDKIDFLNAITAEAAIIPKVQFYRYNELVGLYKTTYNATGTIQYKIGDSGSWTNYTVPFTIPAHQTTKVYARLGSSDTGTYQNLTTTDNALGVYTESSTDFSFSYNNIDFGYTRIYNSADKNWFESIHSCVTATTNHATILLPNGTEYKLVRTATNTFTDQVTGNTLARSTTNSEYTFKEGTYTYHFKYNTTSALAMLSAITDDNGNKLDLTRTTSTNEISIKDATGRKFEISDYQGIPADPGSDVQYYSQKEITDPNGNKLKYVTKQSQYIRVLDQAGVYLGKYQYTNNTTDFRLIKSNDKSIEYYSNGRLKKITYDNGSWIQYTYTDTQKVYTTLTSSGETTRTKYNNAFLPVSYTDEYGETTTYTYDSKYRVKTETVDSKTTTYNYDTYGNVVSYICSDSENNTYYTYDSNKRVVREQTGNDYTYYTYDSHGNNLVYATLKKDYTGEAPALYNASLNCFDTTTYTYDTNGRVTNEVYSTGGSVSYTYDNKGNVLTETTVDENNNSTTVTYTYDAMGNLLTTSKGSKTSSYIYDEAGRTLLANENGECTRTIYDVQGRVIQSIEPQDYDSTKEGLPTSKTYADANVGHRYYYNSTTGNLDREINRLDVETTYEYYSTGEKKKECFDIYEYDYNVKGNLTKVYIDGVNTLSYNYDEDYNLTSEVYANGQSIRYEYDEDGNLEYQYHNNDTTPYVSYSYNSDNELTLKVNTDTGLRYEYDGNNVEVYRLSDNTLVQSYSENIIEEDEENDIEAETDVTETHFGTTISSVIKSNSISYTTGSNTLGYSYNEDDNQVVSDNVKYNNSTALSSNYSYDDKNNITEKELVLNGDSYTAVNAYDNQDRITSSGYGSADVHYSYDENSQVSRVDNNILNYTSTYNYDSRGNILSKNKYNYTRSNSITSSPTETTTFTYSNDGWNDKLVSVNGTPLTYDANGNVLTYGNKSFTWSSGRNLAQITDGHNTYSYTYDECGIRTSKTVNGVTTYFNTKDGVILSQTDGTNTLHFQYDTSGVPIGFIWNNTQYLYLTNQMGDVISIADSQGNELVQYEYDEWGSIGSIETTHNTEAEEQLANINPLRYRGYYFDNETGYYYLQSRYYDSNICRFVNADEHNYLDSYTKNGLNLFVYCSNNSVNFADYNGCAYSPSKAKAYAEKWWDGTNLEYGRNSSGDCANFVSQCLYAGQLSKMTGGFRWGWHCYKEKNVNVNGMPYTTYDRSYAWAAAQNLYDWLKKNDHVSATYTIRNRNDVDKVGKKLYNKAYCCAAIFFDWNNSKTHKGINHATLSGQIVNYKNLYDIYYYAHSSNRNGKRYDSKGNRQYTSIKDAYNQKDLTNMIVYVCILK